MTLHIHYDHQCGGCGAYYIPYEDVVCPNCGLYEEERYDFIPEAADSLLFNLERYSSFLPPAWAITSLADHILRILFIVFEGFRRSGEEDFSQFSKGLLEQGDWGEQPYLKDHIYLISLRVKEEIDKRGNFFDIAQ
ncbi:hypothetical protein H5T87_08095 [bacterium]|nr:hypothetical protein [bacterium]